MPAPEPRPITVAELRGITATVPPEDYLVINKLLIRAASEGRCKASITTDAVTSEYEMLARLVDDYRQQGFKARVAYDQRDGNYIHFEW